MPADPADDPTHIAVRPGAFAADEIPHVKSLLQRMPLRDVARQTGRSKSYLSALAQRQGWDLDRAAQTLPAREAKASDLAVKRLNLMALAAEKLEVILHRLDAPSSFHRVNTRTGELYIVQQDQPTASETRDYAIAAGILADKIHNTLKIGADPSEQKGSIVELLVRMRAHDAAEKADQIIEGTATEITEESD